MSHEEGEEEELCRGNEPRESAGGAFLASILRFGAPRPISRGWDGHEAPRPCALDPPSPGEVRSGAAQGSFQAALLRPGLLPEHRGPRLLRAGCGCRFGGVVGRSGGAGLGSVRLRGCRLDATRDLWRSVGAALG